MPTLESATDEFRQILASASDKLAHASRTTGRWSREQILGHLIDSASNNHQRFVRAQLEDEVALPGYTQAEWVEAQHYQDRDWKELIALWAAYNRHLLHLMEVFPQEKRSNRVRIGGGDPLTIEFVMVDYVRHLKHHLDQIL
jgi:hypothetical protein